MSENASVPTQPQPTGSGDDPEYIKWKEERDRSAPRESAAEETNTDHDSAIQAAVDRALAERDKQHAAEVAKLQAQVPQLVVPAHAGGPGNDHHQRSWNLAEQEAAARGDRLDHWED